MWMKVLENNMFGTTLISTQFTDLYKKFHEEVKKHGINSSPRGMPTLELLNTSLVLLNPRNRILYSNVRKHSYAYGVAEFLWYLRGSNRLDEIAYYLPRMKEFSDDGETLRSAYGHRIFGMHDDFPNQWDIVKNKLMNDPDTRQGVININYAMDQAAITKDVPCTLNLHFMIRHGHLCLFTQMRSNDSFMGLIYDVYSFTMLQEMMYNELDASGVFDNLLLGAYVHRSDSMHLYKRDLDKLQPVLDEVCTVPAQLKIENKEVWKLCEYEMHARRDKKKIPEDMFGNNTVRWMCQKLNTKLEGEYGYYS